MSGYITDYHSTRGDSQSDLGPGEKNVIGKLTACTSTLKNKIDELCKCEHFIPQGNDWASEMICVKSERIY